MIDRQTNSGGMRGRRAGRYRQSKFSLQNFEIANMVHQRTRSTLPSSGDEAWYRRERVQNDRGI